jgi:hypothetical protein
MKHIKYQTKIMILMQSFIGNLGSHKQVIFYSNLDIFLDRAT